MLYLQPIATKTNWDGLVYFGNTSHVTCHLIKWIDKCNFPPKTADPVEMANAKELDGDHPCVK